MPTSTSLAKTQFQKRPVSFFSSSTQRSVYSSFSCTELLYLLSFSHQAAKRPRQAIPKPMYTMVFRRALADFSKRSDRASSAAMASAAPASDAPHLPQVG